MTCKDHYKRPLGTIGQCDCDCPKRPKKEKPEKLLYENCAPFAGGPNTPNNIIFDVEPNNLRVTLAATIENFSNGGLNITIIRGNLQDTIEVPAGSSLSFIHDGVTRVTVNPRAQQNYTGSFKMQVLYEV